jgi:hypothetical protein
MVRVRAAICVCDNDSHNLTTRQPRCYCQVSRTVDRHLKFSGNSRLWCSSRLTKNRTGFYLGTARSNLCYLRFHIIKCSPLWKTVYIPYLCAFPPVTCSGLWALYHSCFWSKISLTTVKIFRSSTTIFRIQNLCASYPVCRPYWYGVPSPFRFLPCLLENLGSKICTPSSRVPPPDLQLL